MPRHRSLLVSILALAAAAPAAHAQSASDYARVVAPDVAAASAFLDGVIGCEPLGGDSRRVLLACGHGSVVEVVHGQDADNSGAPLRLRVEDPEGASAWLHARHVDARVARDAAIERIDLRTPWGQPLQLLGPAPHARQLAAD